MSNMISEISITVDIALKRIRKRGGLDYFVPGLRREDPETIKAYFKKRRDRINKKYKIGKAEVHDSYHTPNTTAYNMTSLGNKGARFSERGRRYWGRSSQRQRLKSAWCYAIAGYCYENAGARVSAAQNYHWAANTFRSAGAYEQSARHYIYSFQQAERSENDPEVRKLARDLEVRSLMRAIGVARETGDLYEEAALQELLVKVRGGTGPTAVAAARTAIETA